MGLVQARLIALIPFLVLVACRTVAPDNLRATVLQQQPQPTAKEEKAAADEQPKEENNGLMDQINQMGKDLCIRRPDHPKCQQFKDEPEQVEEVPAETAPTKAPAQAPAPVAKATPPTVPPTFGTIVTFGEHSKASPTVLPAMEPKAAKGKDLKEWG